jgi:uncharacterized membrane protein
VRVGAVLVVALALVVGVVPQFSHCKTASPMGATAATSSTAPAGGSTLAAARAAASASTTPTPMRCYWSARAEIGVALPLLGCGVLLFFSRRREARRALLILIGTLGAVAMLVPTELIGVCAQSSAVCRTTMLPTLLAAGGLTVALSLVSLIVNELRAEDESFAPQLAG